MPMAKAPYAEFAISQEQDGTRHAINAELQVTVLPHAEDAYLCHERTIQAWGPNPGEKTSILKCRLNGVYVYVVGTAIVMSMEKLHVEDLT